MPKTIDPAALAGVALAGVLAVSIGEGPWEWFSSIVGLTLLLVVMAYDLDESRTVWQSVAFSAVCGFCWLLILGIVFELRALPSGQTFDQLRAAHGSNVEQSTLLWIWGIATVLMLVIDRNWTMPRRNRKSKSNKIER